MRSKSAALAALLCTTGLLVGCDNSGTTNAPPGGANGTVAPAATPPPPPKAGGKAPLEGAGKVSNTKMID